MLWDLEDEDLIETGADVNIKIPDGRTAAAIKALGVGGYATHIDVAQYAYYLIVEKQADVSEPSLLCLRNIFFTTVAIKL